MMARLSIYPFLAKTFICDLCIVEASDLYKFAKLKLKTPLFLNAMDF
jgi:hypothetical protein